MSGNVGVFLIVLKSDATICLEIDLFAQTFLLFAQNFSNFLLFAQTFQTFLKLLEASPTFCASKKNVVLLKVLFGDLIANFVFLKTC